MRRTLIGLVVLLWGCGEENTYVAPPPPAVSVSQPLRQTVTDYIETSGNIQASNSVNLVARVEGFLQSVDFADGTFVKKGDRLYEIDRERIQEVVEQAEGELNVARANAEKATADVLRNKPLIAKNRSTPIHPIPCTGARAVSACGATASFSRKTSRSDRGRSTTSISFRKLRSVARAISRTRCSSISGA